MARPRSRRTRAGRGAVKILFFGANAVHDRRLAIDAEYRAIETSLRSSRYRDTFELVIPKLETREGDLQQALLEHRPDIVHFACHGNTEAAVLLHAADGDTAAVPTATLASMFDELRDNLSLVVFNACWSSDQAAAICQSIGLCIGMREPIDDSAAIKFASEFYRALGWGRSVRSAFNLGVTAIKPADPATADVPELFEAHGVDALRVRFAGRSRPLRRVAVFAGGASLAAAGVAWWIASAAPPRQVSDPSPEMVRFTGALQPRRPRSTPPSWSEGCPPEELADCPEPQLEPLAAARVDGFELDRDEVTNRAYAGWLSSQADAWQISKHGMVETARAPVLPLVLVVPECGGGLIVTSEGQVRAGADKGAWPVTCVTWYGATAYCRAQGKRLPLEREWALAAQGPEGRRFPWGDELPRPDVVSFDLGAGAMAHPRAVGSSLQDVTPQGVRDLGGNVAEWVEDRRGSRQQQTVRGGTWASIGPCHLRGARCARLAAASNQADVGFRCARSVVRAPLDREVSL